MKLNLGCGKDIRKHYVNLDIRKVSGVDVVHDLNITPYPFKKNTFSLVYCDNVLEHLNDIPLVMTELHRICKDNAMIIIKVPYYNCKGSYNDPTHKHYFNKNTLDCFTSDDRSNLKNVDYEMLEVSMTPTRLGKLIPRPFRDVVSTIIGEVYSEILYCLMVIKFVGGEKCD